MTVTGFFPATSGRERGFRAAGGGAGAGRGGGAGAHSRSGGGACLGSS